MPKNIIPSGARDAGPSRFDAEIFATWLQKRRMLIEPGHIFRHHGSPKNSFRIGFPSLAGNKIAAGLEQIGQDTKVILR